MSDEETYPYAPHPFGGQLGPAGIKERRQAPLLAGEIVRLLQLHGVPWAQAIQETAGLMAQTIEETESWWCFEICHTGSPTEAEMIAAMRATKEEPTDTSRLEWMERNKAKVKWNKRGDWVWVNTPRTIGHAREFRDAIDEAMHHLKRKEREGSA